MGRVTDRLARLASERCQRQHILGGRVDEFWDPAELVEDGLDAVRMVGDGVPGSEQLSRSAKALILELGVLLKDSTLLTTNVEHSSWAAVRAKAAACLAELGFDLAAWETHQ